MNKIPIEICICTFHRPHIAETLRSLAVLKLRSEWEVWVIVADNDEAPSAREIVEEAARATPFPVQYIHAPARNISIARNACLNAATAPYVAFIDDDELVTPNWLMAMMEKMESSKSDVVLGPVQALYGADCPDWIREGDFHSNVPVMNEKKTFTGCSTGNALLRRTSSAIKNLRFRRELGNTGGEDTLFFSAIQKAGGHIDYAPDGLITEIVPKNRATFMWLMKRRFRSGQTHAVLLLESDIDGLWSHIGNILLAAAKVVYCGIAAILNIVNPARMRYWLLRGALHAGVVLRLFGKAEIVQYGDGKIEASS